MDPSEEIKGLATQLIFMQDLVRSSLAEVRYCKTISDAEPHLKYINEVVDMMIDMAQESAGLS